ncbi:MAG TPA: DUF2193 domain-containing protein [Anaerolineales bacterium]|nr:DUF2193 domain-containing protein [Anaerolineales bacterium]
MANKVIYKKMIAEASAAADADLGVIGKKRGGPFVFTDAKPYVDAVNGMKPGEGQSKEIFDLHVQSVNAHYDIFNAIAVNNTIRPEDDPFVEHYQTGPILELLYDSDPEFKKSMWKFIDAIAKPENVALIGREATARYGGMYGLTCVVDFGLSVGSVPNTVNQILRPLDIPKDHKRAILAAKSWGMTTSYGLGGAFRGALQSGKSLSEAEKAEIDMLQFIYREPIAAQNHLMATHNLGGHGPHTSFDTNDYQKRYQTRMKPYVEAAVSAGVHYGNILVVPAYCVGDVGHHLGPATYNMFKDDMVFNIYTAVTKVYESTLQKGLEMDAYKSEWDVLSVATGSGACAVAYILWLDSFTVPMVVDLLNKRFHNYAAMNPGRGEADELHNADFIDILKRGEQILDIEPKGNGAMIKGIPVDLSQVNSNEVVMNPQRYTYPACAITQRFAALMSLSDYPCFLTTECVTATLMTNIIALAPNKVPAPIRSCKDCATTDLIKRNVPYMKAYGVGPKGLCQWADVV